MFISLHNLSINDLAKQASRKLTLRITRWLLGIVFPLFLLLNVALDVWSVDNMVKSSSLQAVKALAVGDIIQLVRIKSSLQSSAPIPSVDLFDIHGRYIDIGDKLKADPKLQKHALSFDVSDSQLHLGRRYLLQDSSGKIEGYLQVLVPVDFKWMAIVAIVMLLFVGLVKYFAMIFFSRFAAQIAEPLAMVPEMLKNPDIINRYAITELKVLSEKLIENRDKERQLLAAQREYELQKALSEMALQVAHDIRSPVTAIQIVAKTSVGLDEARKKLLEQASSRVNEIANQLLSTGKQFSQSSKGCNINEVLSQIVDEKKLILANSDVSITLHSDLHKNYWIEGDPIETKRALSNLINNSIESLSDVGNIDVRLIQEAQKVAVEIEDNGRGMPPEVLSRLGQRGVSFGKVDQPSAGNGLGWYHAKKVIEQAKGQIEVSSEEGLGTKIRISFSQVS